MNTADKAKQFFDLSMFRHVIHNDKPGSMGCMYAVDWQGNVCYPQEFYVASAMFSEHILYAESAGVQEAIAKFAEKYNAVIVESYQENTIVDKRAPGKALLVDVNLAFLNVHMTPVNLTATEKLQALANRFYQGVEWKPKKGDYYTTSRADLELYQIVDEDEENFYTSYLPLGGTVTSWPKTEFTTQGFGPKRVWVPDYVLGLK